MLAWLALLTPAALGAQHFPPTQDLELLLRYMVEDGEAPAVVLGVVEPDGTTRVAAWGATDSTRVDGGTVFELGSLTKTFTATLLAEMVLRGEVSLDDPVAQYLPENVGVPDYEGRKITLRDLATHRSGLPEFPPELESVGASGLDELYSWEDAFAFLGQYDLPWQPGRRRQYSSLGYGLLGHALGRALGMDYRQALRARVLGPLGMESATFPGEGPAAVTNEIGGHRSGEPVRSRLAVEVLDASGGLRASADDLLRFLSAQLGEPETPLEEAMRLTHEIQGDPDTRGGGQGLAWGTIVFPKESPVVGHTGSTVGFRSQMAFQPDRGIGTVLLANDYAFDEAELTSALLYMDPVPDSWPGATVPAQVLAQYAGEYRRVDNGGAIYLRLEEEGWLTYQIPEKVRTRLYPRSDSMFFMLRGPWTLTFRTQSDGSTMVTMAIDERESGSVGNAREVRKVSGDTPPPRSVAGHAGLGLPGGVGIWLIGTSCLAALALGAAWWKARSGTSA